MLRIQRGRGVPAQRPTSPAETKGQQTVALHVLMEMKNNEVIHLKKKEERKRKKEKKKKKEKETTQP